MSELLNNYFSTIPADKLKSYSDYWESIRPETEEDVFRRWIFAFTSIHTTWESNIRAYNALKGLTDWLNNKDKLKELLIESKCGLYNNRTKFIWDFKEDFFANQQEFNKKETESWTGFRDRLDKRLVGIGITKVSFTLEMCYPNEAAVVCLDTHMMKIYDMKEVRSTGAPKRKYEESEADLITRSNEVKTAPYISRCLYWDINQGKEDPRYWSYVLEN